MKIITIDNFNREGQNEGLVAENVSEYWAKEITRLIQTHMCSEHSSLWVVAVPDDHKLYKFEP